MKKLTLIIIAVLLSFSLVMPCLAKSDSDKSLSYITDTVGLLTDDECEELEEYAAKLAQIYSCGVYAIIVDDYRDYGYDMERICKEFYSEYSLGKGDDKNAVLLLLSMDDRDFWLIDFGSYTAYAITDYGYEAIKDSFLDDFGDDDWYSGFSDYFGQCEELFEAAESGAPIDEVPLTTGERLGFSFVPAFIMGLIAALVTCSVFKAQMKTARKAVEASRYVVPDGIEMHNREDRFTHTTRTRHRIQSQSSGRSGGGGNHSGGGKF